jgi:hypothetical protein
MAALLSLLSNHGILPDSTTTISRRESPLAFAPAPENVVSRLESPDPPPPRA